MLHDSYHWQTPDVQLMNFMKVSDGMRSLPKPVELWSTSHTVAYIVVHRHTYMTALNLSHIQVEALGQQNPIIFKHLELIVVLNNVPLGLGHQPSGTQIKFNK